MKPLIKECEFTNENGKVEKQFNIAINRDLAVKILEKFPEYWEIIRKNKNISADMDNLSVADLKGMFEMSDELEKILPDMMDYAVPKMLELAECKANYQDILAYLLNNDVDDLFFGKAMEFIMLGFTSGKTVKKPKVQMKM